MVKDKMEVDNNLELSDLVVESFCSPERIDLSRDCTNAPTSYKTNDERPHNKPDEEYLSKNCTYNSNEIIDIIDVDDTDEEKQELPITIQTKRNNNDENDDVEIIFVGLLENNGRSDIDNLNSNRAMTTTSNFALRPELRVNDFVYAMKLPAYIYPWRRGIVTAISRDIIETKVVHSIKFIDDAKNIIKSLEGKYVAYNVKWSASLDIGSRVIAILRTNAHDKKAVCTKRRFYSGIVAEVPKPQNKHRYMVFFDNGYVQYVVHDDMRIIYRPSMDAVDDVSPENREFVRKYLLEYPRYPMVRLSEGIIINVEYRQNWCSAKVLEVDASLVRMHFLIDGREEWIYRGSTRLAPFQKIFSSSHYKNLINRPIQNNMPGSFRRVRNSDYAKYMGSTRKSLKASFALKRTNVARKSTKPRVIITNIKDYLQPWNIDLNRGMIVKMNTANRVHPKEFVPHDCCHACIERTNYNSSKSVNQGPLSVPLYFGFRRVIIKHRRRKTIVSYVAPCGKRLITMKGINNYLRVTGSSLTIDMFNIERQVHCLNEFVIKNANVLIPDISHGKEFQPISCVNYVDYSIPLFSGYMTKRLPNKGVPLNLDGDFLCSCDCTDDCQDKSKCACWQLTYESHRILRSKVPDSAVGYHYRRLRSNVLTGIYECNSRCKCSKTACSNRVVQHATCQKLQLFKTEKKGWGVRCLNDIPRGAFICIYVGCLMTENDADKDGKQFGDEYFAELDYIEVVESYKYGFEAKPPDELMEFLSAPVEEQVIGNGIFGNLTELSDVKYTTQSANNFVNHVSDIASFKKLKYKDFTDLVNVNIAKKSTTLGGNNLGGNIGNKVGVCNSMRNYFGPNEKAYIMDAKYNGNIGRYLNHSCSPNVFVQNVFVDTHDLRFPWVTFFARMYIPAGSELTWDYNYDIGSVKNTVRYCYCNSPNCRGRLL